MMDKIHTNKAYEQELKALRDRIVGMGSRIEKMIESSMRALLQNDVALAKATIEFDRTIDREEILIDKLCVEILARRQPLGQDLRFVVSILKIVTYFERLGDLAVKICQKVPTLGPKSNEINMSQLQTMAERAQLMLRDTVDAFLLKDVQKAKSVLRQDDVMDEIHHHCVRTFILQMGQSQSRAEAYYDLLSVVKWLERMGDHCTNVAELVIFMVHGTDIRHKILDQNGDWTTLVP